MLGSLEGVADVGELRHFWSRVGTARHVCGCGRPLARCPFWADVLDELRDDVEMPTLELREVRRWQDACVRARTIRRVARASDEADLPASPFGAYLRALRCLYRAIGHVASADVVVDSSKKPAYAGLAGLAAGSGSSLIHLVRDPRASAFSWQRVRRADASGRLMPRHSPTSSSVNWIVCNVGSDVVCNGHDGAVVRMRYEDLVEEPRAIMREVAESVGVEDPDRLFADDRTVELPVNHALAGNPSRSRTGRIEVRGDREWLRAQRPIDRLVCEAITLPFLARYGYPLRVSGGPASRSGSPMPPA
jgi:hypothetical protein